ncbi:MAG: hypothetical protein SPJ16_04695 [Helicobacter sp.]|uniref:hypothetical protein n=1 Tax=Helicobacter sp. TaxID=218 RepID=UPI002A919521|nr:hypothetical protein [Helicobacter sp.]MDY5950473.1 hypothetical protein [Helicobacter sp.]
MFEDEFVRSVLDGTINEKLEEERKNDPDRAILDKHKDNVRRAVNLMAKAKDDDFLEHMQGYANLIRTMYLFQ